MFGILALFTIDLIGFFFIYYRDRRVEQLNDHILQNAISMKKFVDNWELQISQHGKNVDKTLSDFNYLADLNRKANDLLMETTFQLKVLEAEKEEASKAKKKSTTKRK